MKIAQLIEETSPQEVTYKKALQSKELADLLTVVKDVATPRQQKNCTFAFENETNGQVYTVTTNYGSFYIYRLNKGAATAAKLHLKRNDEPNLQNVFKFIKADVLLKNKD